METLKVENLSKTFGGLKVLEGLCFTMEAGECVAIIGPNGAGKTTLLNLLSGELQATGGRIYLFGQEVSRMSVHHRVRLGLGHSFQLNSLFSGFTVLENVLLALKSPQSHYFQMLRPMTTYDLLFAKAEELLKSLSLWEEEKVLVENLSYGKQRQLEIALGLALEPRLLLLDEPSAGLSSVESAELANMLYKLTENTSIVFCAHDMELVSRLAHRVIVLYYGRIIAEGGPREIQNNPKVKEIYLGVEKM